MSLKSLILLALLVSSCGTTEVRPMPRPDYNGALAEVYRQGDPRTNYKGYNPNENHTCATYPVFDRKGRYMRSDVKCW